MQRRRDAETCRIVAGRYRQAEEIPEFAVRHHRAVFCRLQDQVEDADIFAGPNALQEAVGIVEQFDRRRRPERQQSVFLGIDLVDDEIRVVRIGVGDQRIPLFDEPHRVLLRDAENLAEHAHRQLARDLPGGIDLALLQRVVEQFAGDLADSILELRDRAP